MPLTGNIDGIQDWNFEITNALLLLPCRKTKGCLKTRAEIIPIEPDAGNADEGKAIKHVSKVQSPLCLRV